MFRPEDWGKHFKCPGDPFFREVFELGADAMHLADVKYLEEHKVLIDFTEEGKAKITFRVATEEWLAFTGKEIV